MGGVEISLHAFFTPFPLHPWGKKPASNLKGDWAVHRADLDILERRELFTE